MSNRATQLASRLPSLDPEQRAAVAAAHEHLLGIAPLLATCSDPAERAAVETVRRLLLGLSPLLAGWLDPPV